jgi:hypothetical protein
MENIAEGKCVKCKGENLEYDGMDMDGECVWYKYTCDDCGDDGVEYYNLQYAFSENNEEETKNK